MMKLNWQNGTVQRINLYICLFVWLNEKAVSEFFEVIKKTYYCELKFTTNLYVSKDLNCKDIFLV